MLCDYSSQYNAMLQSYIKHILFAIQEPLSGQKQMLNLTISDNTDVAVFELTH